MMMNLWVHFSYFASKSVRERETDDTCYLLRNLFIFYFQFQLIVVINLQNIHSLACNIVCNIFIGLWKIPRVREWELAEEKKKINFDNNSISWMSDADYRERALYSQLVKRLIGNLFFRVFLSQSAANNLSPVALQQHPASCREWEGISWKRWRKKLPSSSVICLWAKII